MDITFHVGFTSSGKKFGHFVAVVQLIHRLMKADISCTTARLFFFPLLLDLQVYYCISDMYAITASKGLGRSKCFLHFPGFQEK